jgi:hypothetical protein
LENVPRIDAALPHCIAKLIVWVRYNVNLLLLDMLLIFFPNSAIHFLYLFSKRLKFPLKRAENKNGRKVPYIQSDQQESKSEQALQIIGHVVAKSYAHKRSKHGRRQFMVSNAT